MTETQKETAYSAIEHVGVHLIERGQVVVVVAQKGGQAKTITTSEIAINLAAQGARVRVIDGDGQDGSITALLRPQWDHVDPRERYELADVLSGECTLDQATWPTQVPGIDLVPSSEAVKGYGRGAAELGLEWRVHEALAASQRAYDVTLEDCPPDLGLLTLALLVAADRTVIPLSAGGLDFIGLQELNRTLARVRGERLRPDQVTSAVVITKRESNALTDHLVGQMVTDYPDAMVASARKTVRVSEASLPPDPMPASHYAPTCTAVIDYREITRALFAPVLEQVA